MRCLGFLFLIFVQSLFSNDKPLLRDQDFSIEITEVRDRTLLEEFLRKGFSEEEEYGYVLEGIKPISVRNFQAKDSFFIPYYLDWELLAHEAIGIWNRVCKKKGRFVFKAVRSPRKDSIAAGFELQFINIARLREVIEENSALFRYVLGPLVSTDQLVDRIAYSNETLSSVIRDNLVLTGILLGYGLHNSLIEGKIELLSSQIRTKDEPPFLPVHQFFQNALRQNFLMPEEIYRLYYLEFSGGNEDLFRERTSPIEAGLCSSAIDEELKELIDHEEPIPSSLKNEKPHFIFGSYRGANTNQKLFKRLQRAQQWTQSLIKEDNFFEIVLEKISGKKPVISCPNNPFVLNELFKHREKEWIAVLQSVAAQFDKEGQKAFFDAFCQPTEVSRKKPWAVGVSQASLDGLKKARANLLSADVKFAQLSKENFNLVQERIKGLLYFEKTQEGAGKQITDPIDRVQMSYVIEDQNGQILFAKYRVWIHLRETILGFLHGVQGMKVGEKRTLYIHPALGYGALTTLPLCSALTIKVHLVDIDEHSDCKNPLPPIQTHDLSWVNDAQVYNQIEASVRHIPSYVGSFYRDWLDQKSGLDIPFLVSRLSSGGIL